MKCDGVQPDCGTCRTQGVVCAWSEVATRRGPPKGYRRGVADPTSLLPKIAKIREQLQALQIAYGEKAVKEELHKTVWGTPTCDHLDAPVPQTPTCSSGGSGTCTATTSLHARSESPYTPRERKYEWIQDELEGASERAHSRDHTLTLRPPPIRTDHSNSDQGEGSSSGMAFLANMRNIHSPIGAPMTPVSDSERLAMAKYCPWPRGELGSDGMRRQSYSDHLASDPMPAQVEVLMKTYWSSIHPVGVDFPERLSEMTHACDSVALAGPV